VLFTVLSDYFCNEIIEIYRILQEMQRTVSEPMQCRSRWLTGVN